MELAHLEEILVGQLATNCQNVGRGEGEGWKREEGIEMFCVIENEKTEKADFGQWRKFYSCRSENNGLQYFYFIKDFLTLLRLESYDVRSSLHQLKIRS